MSVIHCYAHHYLVDVVHFMMRAVQKRRRNPDVNQWSISSDATSTIHTKESASIVKLVNRWFNLSFKSKSKLHRHYRQKDKKCNRKQKN